MYLVQSCMRCWLKLTILAFAVFLNCGCTSLHEWYDNGFKVGPNYKKPPAPVASEWIDSQSPAVVSKGEVKLWWTVFHDPKLNELIDAAYRQNLTLRSAGTRILAARAQRNIAVGNLAPQQQQAIGGYTRNQTSATAANPNANRFYNDTLASLGATWEIDFWGRFRRSIEAANAELDASVENYDDALVLLISEVASTYVDIRLFQKQIALAALNANLQAKLVDEIDDQFKAKIARKIDSEQMRSNLNNTRALIETLELNLRRANNQLCVLLGMPVHDLLPELGFSDIPITPPEVVAGMPADLLRRRPDLRRAERLVAAQSARIGVATSDLYPRFILIGALGYESQNLGNLINPQSFIGAVGPTLRWDVLNYGRLLNGIRVQDALFQTAVVDYQNTVLSAGQEVEDGIVQYLRSQSQERELHDSVRHLDSAVKELQTELQPIAKTAERWNRAFVITNFKLTQEQLWAQSQGNIAKGLIQVYKAIGGGWELRLLHSSPPSEEQQAQLGIPQILPEPKE
jgi:NodT family efflux transporter outer membrane factor (OMF) lipoprotein